MNATDAQRLASALKVERDTANGRLAYDTFRETDQRLKPWERVAYTEKLRWMAVGMAVYAAGWTDGWDHS